ncbi:MAG: hypothetical protein OZ921_05730, partial [Sorangiineae bacterium]|nr:hypothetical protein [Sorangiineae bacterium]
GTGGATGGSGGASGGTGGATGGTCGATGGTGGATGGTGGATGGTGGATGGTGGATGGSCSSCSNPSAACTSNSKDRKGCANAQLIGRDAFAGGGSYSASNVTLKDGCYVNACGCSAYGSDNTYRIYLFAGETLTVSVTASGFDPGLGWFFLGASAGGASCGTQLSGGCSDDGAGHAYTAAQTGWYTLVVGATSYQKPGGTYRLDLTLDDCVCGC